MTHCCFVKSHQVTLPWNQLVALCDCKLETPLWNHHDKCFSSSLQVTSTGCHLVTCHKANHFTCLEMSIIWESPSEFIVTLFGDSFVCNDLDDFTIRSPNDDNMGVTRDRIVTSHDSSQSKNHDVFWGKSSNKSHLRRILAYRSNCDTLYHLLSQGEVSSTEDMLLG